MPDDLVAALRAAGFDVAWMRTDAPGSPENVVLARAVAEQRVLLTFDKDFGDLAFHHGLPASCGIILLRLRSGSSAALAAQVVAILSSRTDWTGNFAVIESHRIRFRRLPAVP